MASKDDTDFDNRLNQIDFATMNNAKGRATIAIGRTNNRMSV